MVPETTYGKLSPAGRSRSLVTPRTGRLQLAYLDRIREFRDFVGRPSSILSKRIRYAPVHEPIRPFHERFKMRSGPDVVFRTFSDSDATGLSRVTLEYKKSTYPDMTAEFWGVLQRCYAPDSFIMRAKRDVYFVVSEAKSGWIAGAISYHRYTKTSAESFNFLVAEDFRGLGIGKLLAARSMLAMMSEGIEKFRTFAAPMSQGIVDELGFVEDSRIARLISGGTILSLKSEGDEGLRFLCHSMLRKITHRPS
ncbi:MAG: GNAT family N-acetyltransferase [Candidatus Micrarchaeota archaeon]